MNPSDFILYGAVLAIITAAYYFLILKPKQKPQKQKVEGGEASPNRVQRDEVVNQGGNEREQLVTNRNLRAGRGNRLGLQQQQQQTNQPAEDVEEEKKEEGGDDEGAKSKKAIMREAKKQEKRDMREGFVHALEAKEKKEEERRKRDEEKERLREEEEAKRQELQKKLEEEQRKREEEEYQRWKQSIQVEETGMAKTDAELEEKNMLTRFVDYIKTRKIVMLDDLAAEFKLSTNEICERIKNLEDSKILNGVTDDRGKYIYITEQEMKAIMNYIKQKGRVSKADLVTECNQIIKLDLNPKDRSKLTEEEHRMLEEAEKELNEITKPKQN